MIEELKNTMLTLERKGFWLWGDRLTFPILLFVMWIFSIKWFAGEYTPLSMVSTKEWSIFIAWNILTWISIGLSFYKIPHVKNIHVDQKAITITFANGKIQTFKTTELERLGLNALYKNKIRQGWYNSGRMVYLMIFKKADKKHIIPINLGLTLNNKKLSPDQAVRLLAKELNLKEVSPEGVQMPTWERSATH